MPPKSRAGSRARASHEQFMSGSREEMRAAFQRADANGNGFLSAREFSAFLATLKWELSKQEEKTLFDKMDKNGDGKLNMAEFVDWCLKEERPRSRASAHGEPLPEAAIDRYVSDELRALGDPPPVVARILQLTMALMDVPYSGAASAQRMLSNRSWLTDLKAVRGNLASGKIPAQKLENARQIHADLLAEFGEERIQKASRSALSLWLWATSLLAAGSTSAGTDSSARGHELAACSVHHLRSELLESMARAGFDAAANVYDIEEKVIRLKGADVVCPRDSRKGASYVDSVGTSSEDIGLATHMLSYSWGYKVGDIVETLEAFCQSQNKKAIYVWICSLCVNQHRVKEKQAAGEKVAFSAFRKVFHDRVAAIGNVIAMMAPWDAPVYITRVWCDFELYTATTEDRAKVSVAMPPREQESFVEALREGKGVDSMWQVLANLDVEQAQATMPEDKENILGLIRENPGFQLFNSIVAKHLQAWIVETSETYLQEDLKCITEPAAASLSSVKFTHQVADLFWRIGNAERALFWHGTALKLVQEGGHPDTWKIPILQHLAQIKHRLGETAEADGLTKQAEDLARSSSDGELDFTALEARAQQKMRHNQVEDALRDLEQGLALCQSKAPDDKESLRVFYADIGAAKAQLRDFEGAEAAFRKALELAEAVGNPRSPNAASAWLNIGSCRANRGDITGAHTCFDKALDIHTRLNTLEGVHGAQLLINMGVVLWNSRDVKGAAEKGSHAMKLMEACGMQKSDAYKRAKQLADKVSQQQTGAAEIEELLSSLEETLADLEALQKVEVLPPDVKSAMTQWQQSLSGAAEQLKAVLGNPAAQLQGTDSLVTARDAIQGNIKKIQQQLEAVS
eukprot:TRINITY_DN41183_c0_g1_i1.p1 TRINITY_DN41183_c0_g1~~TRINITY_DN41183_c0_g1_i1.p1  ORF type:complete len:859 (+),score=199.12 TRINITY_DN41183_c0_g1_i1:61-2637(+)